MLAENARLYWSGLDFWQKSLIFEDDQLDLQYEHVNGEKSIEGRVSSNTTFFHTYAKSPTYENVSLTAVAPLNMFHCRWDQILQRAQIHCQSAECPPGSGFQNF